MSLQSVGADEKAKFVKFDVADVTDAVGTAKLFCVTDCDVGAVCDARKPLPLFNGSQDVFLPMLLTIAQMASLNTLEIG